MTLAFRYGPRRAETARDVASAPASRAERRVKVGHLDARPSPRRSPCCRPWCRRARAPARCVSQASTPNADGDAGRRRAIGAHAARRLARDESKCGVSPRITAPRRSTASKRPRSTTRRASSGSSSAPGQRKIAMSSSAAPARAQRVAARPRSSWSTIEVVEPRGDDRERGARRRAASARGVSRREPRRVAGGHGLELIPALAQTYHLRGRAG